MTVYIIDRGFDDVQKWRSELLHSANNEKNRSSFWYEVIRVALKLLRKNDCKVLKEWVNYKGTPLHTLNNSQINQELKRLLRPYMTRLLTHSFAMFVESSVSEKGMPLPFLFIIDEATHFYATNYMHAVMWVLDQTVVDILSELHKVGTKFFILMLGTHSQMISQISHFTPDYLYSSQRVFDRTQFIPSIFISLSWDSGIVFPPKHSHLLDESAHICNLVKWGRACWLSIFKSIEDNDQSRLSQCVAFAVDKLLPLHSDPDHLSSTLAVLALRLHLDFDFGYPSCAKKLVTSKMRWLVDVDSSRRHLVTTYGSEPLLVEAAAYIMNSDRLFKKPKNPLYEFVGTLESELSLGHIDRGRNGELTARLLRMQLFVYF
jgi:hypothetical protein